MAIVNISDRDYRELLREIHNPPWTLFCKGDVKFLSKRCITIVGLGASSYGFLVLNMLLKKYIGLLDVCLVSGMARGIDVAVHSRCLELGIPTIAVIAGGIGNIYPISSRYIYEEICKKGLVVAEYDGRVEMHKGMFPMRNRILAGFLIRQL
jgi:DNA processing protein